MFERSDEHESELERALAAVDDASEARATEALSKWLAASRDAGEIATAHQLRRAVTREIERRTAALKAANQQLREENRAKDEFIARVSHELRNPLNVITGWIALLKSGSLPPEQRERALGVVDRNIRTQTKLVNDLLDASKALRGQLVLEWADVDLAALIEEEVNASLPVAKEKDIELECTVERGLPLVYGDADRLRQVLSNLLSNALKFTPSGGAIRVYGRSAESNVEFGVNDTGAGIPPDFLPFVFDAFRQGRAAPSRASGLGLGLAVSKHLVTLHGGELVAESAGRGQGAHFRVFLPRATAAADNAQSPAASTAGNASALSGLSVLLIEDCGDGRELVKTVLELRGAKVVCVSEAATALSLLDVRVFDIIVSDVGLPGMDGVEFVRSLRRERTSRSSRTPALALTAYARAEERAAILDAGFQAHVTKPLNEEELVDAILALVANERAAIGID